MNLAERQQQLVARYAVIEDLHERLAAVVERARKLAPLVEAEKIDANRVPGCVSRVWIVARTEEARVRFRMDADSTLVKGLVALICELYEGAAPADAAAFEPTLLDALHLGDRLSPTRRNGLAQAERVIRGFAANPPPA